MTRAEVEERLQHFLELVDRQQAIREELLRLKMWGHRATAAEVEEKVALHQALLAEIEELRQARMLPILEELAQFLASRGASQAPSGWGSWGGARSVCRGT